MTLRQAYEEVLREGLHLQNNAYDAEDTMMLFDAVPEDNTGFWNTQVNWTGDAIHRIGPDGYQEGGEPLYRVVKR